VDASEAWKNAAKREYFFGAHDTNRVFFTYGRDILSLTRSERRSAELFYLPLRGNEWPAGEKSANPFFVS